ncbi:HAUS augmin-like complex subunit 6 [Amia ocellicauda]|uniref:HAUS augmin-like complex subunit 6 n=1 Tax=Amia ocellicauda TaxID=2972642 RepID=UPI003464BD90
MSGHRKRNSKYLWWSLLSLGFQPGAAAASTGRTIRHISLGVHMFDKPNKDAFYLVAYFLFEKLNPSQAKEAFRFCWPVLDRKTDAEFRKISYGWLRDISTECGDAFPKVAASIFLSPGGSKFINLMLHFAKHVMMQEMKSYKGDGAWIPEAAASKAQSVETARRRCQLVKNRFQHSAVSEDCVIQEYQKKAQSLVKSLRELRADGAKYDDLLRQEPEGEQEKSLRTEKIKKVRFLWSHLSEVLALLEEERKVVDCVVKGTVDQYTLDGNEISLKIPRLLLERIENSVQTSHVGNVYEAGQVNILKVLQLLNEALKILREERSQAGAHIVELDVLPMADKVTLHKRTLDALKLMRKKITMQEIPEVEASIQKMERDWEKKWEDYLYQKPLTLLINKDPALDLLPPMSPLSFEPATEASCKSSVFSQYPAKLSGLLQVDLPQDGFPARRCISLGRADGEDVVPKSSVISARLPTPCRAASPSPAKTSFKRTPTAVRNVHPKAAGRTKTTTILQKECDNLADQFAEAVTRSPSECGIRGLGLEELLNTLSDPFSTRKQLPRTPESLISDVKSSWRRAVEEGEAEKRGLLGTFSDGNGSPLLTLSDVKEPVPSPLVSFLSKPLLQAENAAAESLKAGNLSRPSVRRERESLHSTLSWNSTRLVGLDSRDNSGVVQFSIANETMPEMLGDESLQSFSDVECRDQESSSAVEKEEEEEEEEEVEDDLFLPRLSSEALIPSIDLRSLRSRFDQIRAVYREMSFTGCDKEVPVELCPSPADLEALKPGNCEAAATVFSLDLDSLESPSATSREERWSLPPLVTFSPMDDLQSGLREGVEKIEL